MITTSPVWPFKLIKIKKNLKSSFSIALGPYQGHPGPAPWLAAALVCVEREVWLGPWVLLLGNPTGEAGS